VKDPEEVVLNFAVHEKMEEGLSFVEQKKVSEEGEVMVMGMVRIRKVPALLREVQVEHQQNYL
jgi:hypothetical protein